MAPAVSASISGGVLSVTSDSAADTIGIDTSGTNTIVTRSAPTPTTLGFPTASFNEIVIVTRSGADTVNILRTARPIEVHNGFAAVGDSGLDVVNLGTAVSGVQGITGTVTIHIQSGFGPGTGYSAINISDTGDTVGRVATHSISSGADPRATILGLAPAAIQYPEFNVGAVHITLGNGADTFTITGTFGSLRTLNTGVGNDTVNVRRTAGAISPLTVTSIGGSDTVNVGTPFLGVQGILGPLTITNPPSFTTINVNNDGDTAGRTGTHSINTTTGIATISGLAPAAINYQTANLQALNITLGIGSDTFTFANTNNAATTLNTGGGNNVVNVQRTGGPLTINGGVDNDTVNVGPSLANISTVGSGLVLNGGGVANTLNFNDTAATAATDYVLQSGILRRNGGAVATFGAFGGALSDVVLNAGNFADTITVTAGSVQHTIVNGNGGADNFFVGTNPATYNGGPGADTLWARDGTNFWLLVGLNTGNYNGVATFASVENLVGNLGHDTLLLFNGAGLSGSLSDQGGNATLDYSAWTTGVYVNLTTAEATNIAGGVYGIANVVGGAGDDILVGDDFGNSLDGGPGRDLVIGGGAGYSGSADYLVGGEGEDIVIGGFTAYDADAEALFAILAEWTQPTDYSERVANLYAGATAPALNETTVFYNYSFGNVLLGLADLDLFFGDPNYDTSDWDPETESFVPVF